MSTREIRCRIIEKVELTPTVVGIRFEPEKKFRFEAGQFLSVLHTPPGGGKPVRRAYSFASPSARMGYELCIKRVEDGLVSRALCSLSIGDSFLATAPHGDFQYESNPERQVCFISTGSGVAPFRAMARSDRFLDEPPRGAMCLFGARTEDEIIYPGFFESLGIETVNAISRPGPGFTGFKGRVTDYLASLPSDWGWAETDFYLCGNGEMVNEIRAHLLQTRGVSAKAIRQEIYFTPADRVAGGVRRPVTAA